MSDNLWNRVANFFKEWDGEDMTKSMPLYVDELRRINSNRIELIRLERERKGIRNKAIDEFVKFEDYLMSKIKEEIVDVNIDFEWRKVVCLDDIGTKLRDGLREIAEQMKEVGE